MTLDEALRLIEIEPLPPDFWQRLSRWRELELEKNPGGVVTYTGARHFSERAVLTFIRHELTNYDLLWRDSGLTDCEIDQLRCAVNERALRNFHEWRQAR